MASTYTINGPWHGQTDGWRWTMRRLVYTSHPGLGLTPITRSEVTGEWDRSPPEEDPRQDRLRKPFTVDFLVPNSGGVIARCLLVGYQFGYSASTRWVGARAECEMVRLPEYRLPQHPLWGDGLDGLMAACDLDDGVRGVTADWLRDRGFEAEADELLKTLPCTVQIGNGPKARGTRMVVGRPSDFIRDLRLAVVQRHCREHGVWLPGTY